MIDTIKFKYLISNHIKSYIKYYLMFIFILKDSLIGDQFLGNNTGNCKHGKTTIINFFSLN